MAILNNLAGRIGRAGLLLALGWPATGQPPAPAARLDLLKAKGVNAEVTVLPAGIGGRSMPEVGEVLALFLEHGGMPNVEWTRQVFPRTGEAGFQQMCAEFGAYIRRGGIATPYALYAEVLGNPGVGITEVRAVLADKDGEPVWSYRQTPEDETFRRTKPREPLQCLFMVVNALREPLGLQDPFRPDVTEGKLTKRYAERTGLPTSSERAAIQKALANARARYAAASVTVFAVLVDGQPDSRQAAHLAEALSRAQLGKAEIAATQPKIQVETGPNEQQRLWKMARAVREQLRQTPAATDYAMYADYVFAPGGGAFTVHFILCEGKGDWVIVDLQNDHHPDFRSMELRSGDDCDRLVVKRLDGLLRKAPGGGN